MNEIDFNFDFNLEVFSDIEFDLELEFNNRYIKPPKTKVNEYFVKYDNALKLAKEVVVSPENKYYFVINGSFIFGDFIEALIVENNWLVERLVISTLSMSENNVDSLRNLIDGDYVRRLDLIVSDHFFSHERHNLVPYIYEQLDIEDKFQFAVAGTHCKIALIHTECGKKIIMDGSANLRSSGNIEQFRLEQNEPLYEFNLLDQDNIIEKFKTINKDIPKNNIYKTKTLRHRKLWQVVAKDSKE